MAAIVARLRAAYAAELAKYARHHRSRANLWLHAVLAPVEWAACLVALRCAAGGACFFGGGWIKGGRGGFSCLGRFVMPLAPAFFL